MDFYLPGGASGCGRTSTTLCASAAQCLANARTANISVISRRKRWVSRIGRENRRVMWCSVTCENEVCVSLNPRKLQRGEPMIEVKYEHIVNHFMQRRSIICRDIGGESWEVSVCEYLQSINQFIFRTKDIMLSTIVRIYIQRFLQNLLARLRLFYDHGHAMTLFWNSNFITGWTMVAQKDLHTLWRLPVRWQTAKNE